MSLQARRQTTSSGRGLEYASTDTRVVADTELLAYLLNIGWQEDMRLALTGVAQSSSMHAQTQGWRGRGPPSLQVRCLELDL
jgi:hypothetical protein